MKFQVVQPFSINRNGRRTEYRMGQRISEVQYRRLNTTQQSRFLSARSSASKTPYTRNEITQLVNLYLDNNDDLNLVKDLFCQLNPNSGHSVDSVYQTAAQLRTLDNHYPNDTQWAVKSLVREVAESINPDRFINNLDIQLDALLAEIRG